MSAAPSVHDLLLALAGRLDDDLLAWGRELLAVGEQDQAVELVTAALVAERVALPAPVRTGLAAAAEAAHTDLDVDRALPAAVADDVTPHRFAAGAGPRDAVVTALRALPGRRLAGCTLRLTWRRTPAGATPGPLPHPVLLVEADPDRSPDVLAYLLATELERAGAPASVEVFTAGSALPAYHAAALRDADELLGAPDGPRPARHGADGPQPASVDDGAIAVQPVGVPAGPDTTAEPGAATVRQPAVGRRRRPDPVEEVSPASPGPATDPLNGPLREPLLAPLLEPSGSPDADPVAPEGPQADAPTTPSGPEVPEPRDVPEEWDGEWRSGEWAMPRTAPPEPADGPEESFDVFGTPGPVPDTGLPRRGEETGRFPRDAPEPAPAPVRRPELPAAAPGEVSLFESPTARVEHRGAGPRRPAQGGAGEMGAPDHLRAVPPVAEGAPEVSVSGVPVHRPGPLPGRRRRPEDDAPAGPAKPDPEPSALLKGTERDLLAQLQAELADQERRPRPYRRAGQNGRSHSVNGHGPGDDRPPPDLAG
jgi:hypothetical protein